MSKDTRERNTVTIPIVFDKKRDKDVLDWLESLPAGKRSEIVRHALRAGQVQLAAEEDAAASVGRALREIDRKLEKLSRRIEAGISFQPAGDNGGAPAEPQEAVAALEKLGEIGML